jgi:hypothetical protein
VQREQHDMTSYLMVVAIDFGTTYSGYAFSTKSNFLRDPLYIQANQAWNGGKKQLMSLKTPTCLLLDNRKEIVSFGYEAEDAHAELVLDGVHNEYYFFDRFKMKLYENKVCVLNLQRQLFNINVYLFLMLLLLKCNEQIFSIII